MVVSKHNGKLYEIGLWKREPGKDLFIGNDVDTCLSSSKYNKDVIYGGLVNTNVQYILIKEKATKQVKGYARVYFIKEQQSNKKNIMLDTYEAFLGGYIAYSKSETCLFNFIENYSKAVTNNNSSKTFLKALKLDIPEGSLQIMDKFETIGKVASGTRTSTNYISEPDYTRGKNLFRYIPINQ